MKIENAQQNTVATTSLKQANVSSSSKILTVIVTDEKGAKASGAKVTLNPGGTTVVTPASGEVQLKLGTASKYEVTVVLGNAKVTVPYYYKPGGATRLLVNPVYVQSVEAKVGYGNLPAWLTPNVIEIAAVIFVVFLVLLTLRKLFRRR